LEAALGYADVDRDNAVVDLTQATQVLPLYAGRLIAPLLATGFIDDPDQMSAGAQNQPAMGA
jgi:hypothetical protein